MKKIINKIKNNWLLYFIVVQPILDMISYFQVETIGKSFSWVIRIFLLVIVSVKIFSDNKNKKKLLCSLLPYCIYLIFHLINLYRINEFSLIVDIKYFILVFQMPILVILLVFYLKENKEQFINIKKGIVYNFLIISISIFFSIVTKSYETTYTTGGIIGWFSGANTPSMILCAITPWVLYYFWEEKNNCLYFLTSFSIFVILFINGTKSCYITLVFSFIVMTYLSFFQMKKKSFKIMISFLFVFSSLIFYNISVTSFNRDTAMMVEEGNKNEIKAIIKNQQNTEKIDFSNLNLNNQNEVIKILNTSYIYRDLIAIHGEDRLYKEMKDIISPNILSNNRVRKVINAKIEFDDSDLITKLFGIGYSRISKVGLDLENDLTAIFYYYGYVGFFIYSLLIIYFICLIVGQIIKNKSNLKVGKFIILIFLIALLLFGGEYSGAFLRKPNANIYLSLYLTIFYISYGNKSRKILLKKNKITFLLLHLGYGGIETATINSANALCDSYDVELISFYKLNNNQEKNIDKKIKIKYLYNDGPNKESFYYCINKHKYFLALKEGLKALSIIYKKKYLVKKEIINSDSFAIISTRYSFSVLLSNYGEKKAIKIAQEHHHHNNNYKYINTIKRKYKNIDYLCALTKELKKDYEKFLIKNIHTKVVLLPNMMPITNHKLSNLNRNNLISIGRLHKDKKINELIELFSKIENSHAKLYIIGDGPETESLKKLSDELNLKKRIVFLGFLSKEEQKKYLLNSCLFLMTSVSEGLPMVLLEAMDYGIPCIAYETDSGTKDIIKDNKNGFIIKNRDEKKFILAINMLLKDNKKVKEFSMYAKNTVKNFSKEQILKIWNRILK